MVASGFTEHCHHASQGSFCADTHVGRPMVNRPALGVRRPLQRIGLDWVLPRLDAGMCRAACAENSRPAC